MHVVEVNGAYLEMTQGGTEKGERERERRETGGAVQWPIKQAHMTYPTNRGMQHAAQDEASAHTIPSSKTNKPANKRTRGFAWQSRGRTFQTAACRATPTDSHSRFTQSRLRIPANLILNAWYARPKSPMPTATCPMLYLSRTYPSPLHFRPPAPV